MIQSILSGLAAFTLFLLMPACIYMDARTGCNEVRVSYDIDAANTSGAVAPSLDYHRDGTGQSATNSARQDGRLSAVGDAALKAIGETVAACASGGISEAPTAARMLAERLGRDPSAAELAELERQRLPQP